MKQLSSDTKLQSLNQTRECYYYLSPLWYDIASAAGAALRLYSPAMMAIGKRYGSINRNSEGTAVPIACSPNWNASTIPKIRAPHTIQNGFHRPNITTASAIQPCPAVMFSRKFPVVTRAKYEPPIPASAPPMMTAR